MAKSYLVDLDGWTSDVMNEILLISFGTKGYSYITSLYGQICLCIICLFLQFVYVLFLAGCGLLTYVIIRSTLS